MVGGNSLPPGRGGSERLLPAAGGGLDSRYPVVRALRHLGEKVLDTLFPRRCVDCGAEGSWVCGTCLGRLARRLIFEPVGRDTYGLFSLEEKAVREALHSLKYDGIDGCAEALVEVLSASCEATDLKRALGLEGESRLVPVPIGKKRLRARGYNQAERLASALGVWLGIAVEDGLLTKGAGKTLVGAGRHQRQRSALSGFAVAPEAAVTADVTYLIVDDVLTTGSTLFACRALLKAAGAESVKCVAFGYRHREGELA